MDIQKMIDDYAAWIKSEITFDKIGDYYEITTPYLDNSNDYLQIYVRQDHDELYFTDDGATLNRLEMNGFNLSPTRRATLTRIVGQFGVKLEGSELVKTAPAPMFAQTKHSFVQAILRVDDVFNYVRPRETSLFLDEVCEFFAEKEIFYADNAGFPGKSGLIHYYDFLFQRSKTKPERLCQTVNTPNRTNVSNTLFSWYDTKPSRKSDSQLIVILNDRRSIASGIQEAIRNYDAEVILWSDRNSEKSLSLLSAS